MAPLAPMPRGLKTPPAAVFRANCAFKAPQCDQGHQLFICICRVGSQVCDACMRRIQSTYTHRCKICDFDLCRRCYSSPVEESLQASLRPLLEESSVRSSSGAGNARDGAESGAAAQAGQYVSPVPDSTEPGDFSSQMSSGPFFEAPWRLAYPDWLPSDHRNEQMRSLYGDRPPVKLPAWFRGGSQRPPAGLRQPFRGPREAALPLPAANGAVDPTMTGNMVQSLPVADSSVEASSTLDANGGAAEAASKVAAMGMPHAERLWRMQVAEMVAIAIGSPELPKSRRPSPRPSSMGVRGRR
mmetsp:Transcript_32214/g.53003  ORF Transcript_32214/g.53003 Transcript_32214/m.53003 type:complete len:299 (-) Transcript_32214:117-1013(-)